LQDVDWAGRSYTWAGTWEFVYI